METIQHIRQLLAEARWEEANAALAKLVHQKDFVDGQAGEAYVTLIASYVGALRAFQERYHAALDAGIAILKVANEREHEMKDGIDLARVKREIEQIQRGD